MIYVSTETARMDFAKEAAAHFQANPHHNSFGKFETENRIALRWGLGDDCVLVLQLDPNEAPVIFQQIIPRDVPSVRVQLAELKAEREDFIEARAARLRENQRQADQIVALVAALEKYGWHDSDCESLIKPTVSKPDMPCTCGFRAALKAAKGEA